MSKRYNLIGKRFNKLIVIKKMGSINKNIYWECQCDCGNIVKIKTSKLVNKHTGSCGCYSRLLFLERSKGNVHSRLAKGIRGFNQIIAHYKANAKRKIRVFSLTKEECKKLFESNCFYCGRSPSNICSPSKSSYTLQGKENAQYIYNGLDRLDNNKDYIYNNVVSCCKQCNHLKGFLLTSNETQEIIKLLKQLRKTDNVWNIENH